MTTKHRKMDKKVLSFISKHPDLQHQKETDKVKCVLSGHEMPCRLEALQSYVRGKKYAKLKARKEFDFNRLEPLIVQSKKRRQLFCALTGCYVNRKPHEVKSHMAGRKYCKALGKYTAGELELQKERLKPSKDKENKDDSGSGVETENPVISNDGEVVVEEDDLKKKDEDGPVSGVIMSEANQSDSETGMDLNSDEVQPSRKRKRGSKVTIKEKSKAMKIKTSKVSNGKLKKAKI